MVASLGLRTLNYQQMIREHTLLQFWSSHDVIFSFLQRTQHFLSQYLLTDFADIQNYFLR